MVTLRRRRRSPAEDEAELEAALAARARPASFPFISGDTFRSMADVVIDETGVTGTWRPGGTAFCAPKYVPTLLDLTLSGTPGADAAMSMSLILHNGDVVPDVETYGILTRIFRQVLSVNVSAEVEELGVLPIPIGLENLHWSRNGLLGYFDQPHLTSIRVPAADREISVLASFRSSTNPELREPLRELALHSDVIWHEPSTDPAPYFSLVRQATFVLSPPGNGPDCHRTWESIYLGAIPVLRAGTLSPQLARQLPVLEIDDWAAFLSLSGSERSRIARTIQDAPRDAAYIPFWCARL